MTFIPPVRPKEPSWHRVEASADLSLGCFIQNCFSIKTDEAVRIKSYFDIHYHGFLLNPLEALETQV